MPIFDQGYQHWQGTLGGHGWRWLAITRHGVRVGMKNRFIRRILLTAWIPALTLAAVVCLWGMVEDPTSVPAQFVRSFDSLRELAEKPQQFRAAAWTLAFHGFLRVEVYFALVLVLLVGPGLISEDLRFNALPLYFSRPIRRIDYFLGKLGIIGFFLGAVTVVPAVVAWCLGVLFSLDFSVIGDTFRLLVAVIAYGIVVTFSAGLLVLALSSLTRNSRYVAVIWAGFWLITLGVSALLTEVHHEQLQRRFLNTGDRLQRIDREIALLDGQQPGEMRPPIVGIVPKPHPQKEAQERLDQLRKEQARILGASGNDNPNAYEEEQRADWRPLISYSGNLQRIGYALLGSRDAWEKVDLVRGTRFQGGNVQNVPHDPQFHGNVPHNALANQGESLASKMVPSYPWYWSALILLGLGGLSVWILNTRVKNLDRLR